MMINKTLAAISTALFILTTNAGAALSGRARYYDEYAGGGSGWPLYIVGAIFGLAILGGIYNLTKDAARGNGTWGEVFKFIFGIAMTLTVGAGFMYLIFTVFN